MKKKFFIAFFFIFSFSSSFAQTDSSFTPSGKVNAQLFTDYIYVKHAPDYTIGSAQYAGYAQDYASFEIRRLFLGYNYDFTRDFTGEILFSYEGNLDGSGNRGVLLKVADIKWKNIFPNSDFLIGLQFTPAFVLLTEKVWGYRSIEKTILDKNKFAAPTDLGAGLQGAFDNDKNYGYNILYADGTGTKPENDRYKKIYADLWGKFLDKRIIVDFYGDLEQKSDIPIVVYQTAKFFLAYQSDPLTVGLEAFVVYETRGVQASPDGIDYNFTDVEPFGYSFFVTGAIFPNKLNFFARYDSFDPDLMYDPSLYYEYSTAKEHFITTGLDWTPYSAIHIMPNIWYTNYTSKTPGVTGTALSDYNLVPRITFSFKY
jgi:hypothetical protein